MTLVADDNGMISGKFMIPANVPAGTRAVTVQGERVNGVVSYTGAGVVSLVERRRITTNTRFNWINQPIDPLAQTFRLDVARHVAGVDLWFKQKGLLTILVQIRETTAGLPNSTVLAQSRIPAAALSLTEATRITWEPVWLEDNREYALVVLTDDPLHAIAVAEVGKHDPESGWITAQPYQVGVLLSSANASTWTPHQLADMAFRLLAAKFEPSTKIMDLGTQNLSGYTDLLVQATVERTSSNTEAKFRVGEFYLKEGTPLSLPVALAGQQTVSVELTGSEHNSPVLYPGVQLLAGKLRNAGTYISRAIPCGTNARVVLRFEALLPGQSGVEVALEINGVWSAVNLLEGEPVGDNWVERTYLKTPVSSDEVRVRLTLTGSAADRPKIRKLRLMTTDAE